MLKVAWQRLRAIFLPLWNLTYNSCKQQREPKVWMSPAGEFVLYIAHNFQPNSAQINSPTWCGFTSAEQLLLLHSGFFPPIFVSLQNIKRSYHESKKNDISQEPIDDLALKLIFFFAFFAIIDQFRCQIINCFMRNITFTTHAMNAWCFEAKPKMGTNNPLCPSVYSYSSLKWNHHYELEEARGEREPKCIPPGKENFALNQELLQYSAQREPSFYTFKIEFVCVSIVSSAPRAPRLSLVRLLESRATTRLL